MVSFTNISGDFDGGKICDRVRENVMVFSFGLV